MLEKKKMFEKKKTLTLPNHPLSNTELLKFVKILKIPNFRGVFMRNALPFTRAFKNESGIINLDDRNGLGTHWTCYRKVGNKVWYFDSFGNIKPPKELFNYLNVNEIFYNQERYQEYNSFVCGHLCLKFLHNEL